VVYIRHLFYTTLHFYENLQTTWENKDPLSGGASMEGQTVSISSLQTSIVLISDAAELPITEIIVVGKKHLITASRELLIL